MDEHFRKRRETLTQDNGLCRSREIRNLLTSWQCEPRYDDNRPSQWVRGVPSITRGSLLQARTGPRASLLYDCPTPNRKEFPGVPDYGSTP